MSVVTPTADVRQQLRDLRGRLKEQRDETATLRERFAEDGSRASSQQLARSVNAEADIKAEIEELQSQERGLLKQLSGGNGVDASGPLGEQLADPGFAGELAKLATNTARIGDLSLGDIDRETCMGWTGRALAANGLVTPTPGMTQSQLQRVVPLPTAPPRFLDLVPSTSLESGSFAYAQEVSASGGPAPTVPMAVKPSVDFSYQDAEANPATIAGWVKIARQTLADVPTLAAVIQTRLLARTQLALETEVLSGDGSVSDRTGKPGIVGLLGTTGVAVVTPTGSEPVPDSIIDAITDVLMVGAVPNVCAINPRDWATLLKTKSSGSGEYVASPFLATAQQVWGVTLTPAVGVPQGKIIVGDTNLGITLMWREGANIRIGEESDDMTRNRVTILCELRAALAVWVPTAFCIVDLS